jgi:tetratricopeptide (TPR) repeat protein
MLVACRSVGEEHRMIRSEAGLECTAANERAVAAFDATVMAYAGFRRDIGLQLKSTFGADPDMPMAHVLKGLFLQFMAVPAVLPKARDALAAARAAADRHGASMRERLHVEALDAWIRGNLQAAIGACEAILRDHPLDLLALKLANFFYFYLGDTQNLRDVVARVLPAWQPAQPGYGFVLSLYAFGLEENGQYPDAERLGRQAFEINPGDAWAVHAVAHVNEMQHRHEAGIGWLADTERHWSPLNNFRYHLWWHLALQYLHRGDGGGALRLYDERLWDPASDEYLDLANDISLLQRLEIAGIDVGDRWQPLADKVEKLCSRRYFAFVDAHYLLALAAAGRRDQAGAMLDALRSYSQTSGETAAVVTSAVNGALCEALYRYRDGDYARAVALLAPVQDRLHALGGSHAQRDLFARILADARTRAG